MTKASSILLNELIKKQLKNIPNDKKLRYNDLKRLCKYITSSIFDENRCTLWNGYITNVHNVSKGIYINFYFKGKKAALHRLLYINFVGQLLDDEYLKFSCESKGKCCNIAHFSKFQYIKKDKIVENTSENTDSEQKTITKHQTFVLNFD